MTMDQIKRVWAAYNEAVRAVAALTGLAVHEHPSRGELPTGASLSGVYGGVAVEVSLYADGDGSYTRVIVPGFPTAAGPALRAALGRKVRLRAKAKAPSEPTAPLPPDLIERLSSCAQRIWVEKEGLEVRLKPKATSFWNFSGISYDLETDPERLKAVLDALADLGRLVGAQAREMR